MNNHSLPHSEPIQHSDDQLDLLLENFGERFDGLCATLDRILFDPQINRARVEVLKHFDVSAQAIPDDRREAVISAVAGQSVGKALEGRLVSPSELVSLGHRPDLLAEVLKARLQKSTTAARSQSLWYRVGTKVAVNSLRRIAALLVFGVLGIFAFFAFTEYSIAKAELNDNRAELAALERRIKDLGLNLVVVPGADLINVGGPDTIKFSVLFNSKFIDRVLYRFGTEPDGRFEVATADDLIPDPLTGLIRFAKTSPPLARTNKCVKTEVKFIPKAGVDSQFPEFFTADRLQYRRSFFLGSNGVEMDVETIELTDIESVDGVERSQSEVGREAIVKGRLRDMSGWPVVLVHSQAPGQFPWVQDSVKEVSPEGTFSTLARFGDNGSEDTKFVVQIVLAPNRDAADALPTGRLVKPLPPGWIKSRPIIVTRK